MSTKSIKNNLTLLVENKSDGAHGVAFREWGSPGSPASASAAIFPPSPKAGLHLQGDRLSWLWPAGIPIVQCPQWGQEELWSLQAYLPSQTCPLPLIPRPRVPLRSLSEKLPPLLPHQWAVLQSDRLHGAVGDWRAEKKRNRPS